jgi:hypothetical protein
VKSKSKLQQRDRLLCNTHKYGIAHANWQIMHRYSNTIRAFVRAAFPLFCRSADMRKQAIAQQRVIDKAGIYQASRQRFKAQKFA